MSRLTRILRWVAIAIGGSFGLLALALAGLYAWAQSDAGRSRIARSLEDAVSVPGELSLHIGALEGRLLDAPRVTGLAIDDSAGIILLRLPRESRAGYIRLTEHLLSSFKLDAASGAVVVVTPTAIRVTRRRAREV